MLEYTFALPLEGLEHPDGGPILYGGRADEIAVSEKEGLVVIADNKTTSSLGPGWASSWSLDSQITGYIWAIQHYLPQVSYCLIRGTGLLKTKVSHASVLVHRAPWQIEAWLKQLRRDIQRMLQAYEEGWWGQALSRSQCSICSYELLCSTPEPERWVEGNFRTREWNPLREDGGETLGSAPRAELFISDLIS